MSPINTELYSAQLRKRAILLQEEKILISRLSGSLQEKDISTPVNCQGYGRVHHFHWHTYPDWSANPLPLLPAMHALGLPKNESLRAQVFQNAACNWRCWYCYVDFTLLSANQRLSHYFTADELVDLYLQEDNPAPILDLSGGQPDITPEWVLWMMQFLTKREKAGHIFLWSDDNLSNRYFWRFLTASQRGYIATFPNYARVGCFKGYDEASFAFNTLAEPNLFYQQFEIYRSLLNEGLDMYAYVTFTALPHERLAQAVMRFVDKLQFVHHNLPLRTIPLKIDTFTPTHKRIQHPQEQALKFQHDVHQAWLEELDKRFSAEERQQPIYNVQLG